MEEQWSRLRHDLRSGFNNLRLCVAAFETETDPAERVQWMLYVEKAADKCLGTIDEIERLVDAGASSGADPATPSGVRSDSRGAPR